MFLAGSLESKATENLLKSAVPTFNKKYVIGLISSIIAGGIGYALRLVVFNYLDYDVFSSLDNLYISLSYFFSLGGITFLIKEYLNNNAFCMSYCGRSDVSLPTKSNSAAVYNSTMQNPNNPSSASTMKDPHKASAADPSARNLFHVLESNIADKKEMLDYYQEQVGY